MPGNVRNPLFNADWLDVVFVHFRVDAGRLQPLVPLPLDLHDGDAYVSLVAFTQENLRPSWGGRLGALLAAPLARHAFLNVRTYVRHGDASGIFFLAEWIPNRIAAFIGPRTYGLPYRLGRLDYRGLHREVEAAGRRLTFQASLRTGASPLPPAVPAALDQSRKTAGRRESTGEPSVRPSLDDFLLERYVAFTSRRGITRRFDVAHEPWSQQRVDVRLSDTGLLPLGGSWFDGAELVAAHHSPGVRDVIIGPPRRVLPASPRRRVRA